MKEHIKKVKAWQCVLCGVNYIHDGEELTVACMWTHIFRKDEHYMKLQRPLPTRKKKIKS